jgi:prepilin-type N-terminal cleavage/methylation domain-containing protein
MVKKAATGLTKIFHRMNYKSYFLSQLKSRSEDRIKGFTLIELLVVMAIVALMSMMVLPNVSSYFQLSLNSATRDIATTVKEAYNATVITGNVYRVVYDLKEHQFWVESGPPTFQMETKESKERESRRKRLAGDADKAAKSSFTMDKIITRKKVSLPRGVEFEDIITEENPEPIIEGTAYTHLFPHGIAESTIIHLKDTSKHHVSLVIQPLIGMTDLYDRYINKAEAFGD